MNSTAKLLTSSARASLSVVSRRAVSDIRITPKSVVYNGKTYTRMIYPYTMTARIVHFPWTFEWQKNWHQRYLIYAFILAYPLWVMIHNAGTCAEQGARKHSSGIGFLLIELSLIGLLFSFSQLSRRQSCLGCQTEGRTRQVA